jgi:2-oxoisovalerate dehydrogenase E2 component (dihydrolipoyl transacylase)
VALRDFPQINARYDDEAQVITRLGAVHGRRHPERRGLMVPVRATPKRAACGAQRGNRALATAARHGQGQPR